MGQLTQPLLRMSFVSVSVSPETASALSKWPLWKFFCRQGVRGVGLCLQGRQSRSAVDSAPSWGAFFYELYPFQNELVETLAIIHLRPLRAVGDQRLEVLRARYRARTAAARHALPGWLRRRARRSHLRGLLPVFRTIPGSAPASFPRPGPRARRGPNMYLAVEYLQDARLRSAARDDESVEARPFQHDAELPAAVRGRDAARHDVLEAEVEAARRGRARAVERPCVYDDDGALGERAKARLREVELQRAREALAADVFFEVVPRYLKGLPSARP